MSKISSAIVLILAVMALIIFPTACGNIPNTEELKNYFEVLDFNSKWVKKYYSPWPEKLTLVPQISFRIKNLTEKAIKHVYFNAIFKVRGIQEVQGDDLYSALSKKPLMPGEVSDIITMTSNYGAEGKRLNDFKSNPVWKATVKLFVKYKGSRYALIGEWDVSREIDFEPDKPLTPEKK